MIYFFRLAFLGSSFDANTPMKKPVLLLATPRAVNSGLTPRASQRSMDGASRKLARASPAFRFFNFSLWHLDVVFRTATCRTLIFITALPDCFEVCVTQRSTGGRWIDNARSWHRQHLLG